jgi:hypothetical protein
MAARFLLLMPTMSLATARERAEALRHAFGAMEIPFGNLKLRATCPSASPPAPTTAPPKTCSAMPTAPSTRPSTRAEPGRKLNQPENLSQDRVTATRSTLACAA